MGLRYAERTNVSKWEKKKVNSIANEREQGKGKEGIRRH